MKVKLSILKEYLSHVLVEGRVDDAREKYPDMEDDDFDTLVANQPAGSNNKYLMWSCKQVSEGFSSEVTIQAIRLFDGNVQRLQKKSIDQYKDVGEVEDAIIALGGDSKSQQTKKAKANTDTVYQDDRFVVVRPYTQDASCKYGARTKWCISATASRNYFTTYSTSNNKFYFIIDKKAEPSASNAKIALAIISTGSIQVYDAADKLIDLQTVAKYVGTAWPEMWKKIQEHVTKNPTTYEVDDAQKETEEHVKALMSGENVTIQTLSKIARDGKLTINVVKAIIKRFDGYSQSSGSYWTDDRLNIASTIAMRAGSLSSDVAIAIVKWLFSIKPANEKYWHGNNSIERIINESSISTTDFYELAKTGNERILTSIMSNPNAPEDLKLQIGEMVKNFKDENSKLQTYELMIKSGKITLEQFKSAFEELPELSGRILYQPESVNLPEEFIRLIPVRNSSDLMNILKLPNISTTYAAELIDKSWEVLKKYDLYEILKSTPLDTAMIEKLWKDKDQSIRTALLQNPSIGTGNASTFAKSKNSAYRFAIAHNPITLPDDLLLLATDESVSTRSAVASNPKLPAEMLSTLARDEAIAVRAGVASNKSTPQNVLKALLRDTDSFTSKAARKTLKSLQTAEAFRHMMMGTLLREALEDNDTQDMMTPGWQDISHAVIDASEFVVIFLLQNNGHATREEIEEAYNTWRPQGVSYKRIRGRRVEIPAKSIWQIIQRNEKWGTSPTRTISSTGKGWFWSPPGINKGALIRITPSGAAAGMEILERLRKSRTWPSTREQPPVRKSPAPASLNPAAAASSATATGPRGPKTTYKIYGKFKGHPTSTRLKGQAYVGANDTRFVPGEQAYITPEDGKLKVKKADSDHTQTWDPIDG